MTSWMSLEGWRRYTTAEFRLAMFPGGHFFIADERPRVLRTIVGVLSDGVDEPERSPAGGTPSAELSR